MWTWEAELRHLHRIKHDTGKIKIMAHIEPRQPKEGPHDYSPLIRFPQVVYCYSPLSSEKAKHRSRLIFWREF